MNKKLVRSILIFIFLFVIELLLNSISLLDLFLLRNITSFYLFILVVILIFYFYFRVLDKPMRRYLISIGLLLALLLLFRASKYIAFEESNFIARHLWYFYYLPFIFTPPLTILASLSVGEDGLFKRKGIIISLLTFSSILFLIVLTNDLHQWVFKFNENFINWDNQYSYGIFYFVLIGILAIEMIIIIIILIKKCSLSAAKKMMWLPLLPILYSIVWMVFYALGVFDKIPFSLGELPEVFGFSIAGFFLGSIEIGLIPTNKYSKEFFLKSNISAFITDNKGNIHIKGNEALELSNSDLIFDKTKVLSQDIRLHKNKINGGFVYWSDDIKELNQINEKLEDTIESMMDENELIRLENDLAFKDAFITAKEKTYDNITLATKKELDHIKVLAEKTKDDLSLYDQNIKYISILIVYIKRYANLMLEANDSISLDEFYLSLNEIVLYLQKSNINAFLNKNYENRNIDSKNIMEAFQKFGDILNDSIEFFKGIMITINDNGLKLVLEGIESTIAKEIEDNTSYIDISFGGDL